MDRVLLCHSRVRGWLLSHRRVHNRLLLLSLPANSWLMPLLVCKLTCKPWLRQSSRLWPHNRVVASPLHMLLLLNLLSNRVSLKPCLKLRQLTSWPPHKRRYCKRTLNLKDHKTFLAILPSFWCGNSSWESMLTRVVCRTLMIRLGLLCLYWLGKHLFGGWIGARPQPVICRI